VLDNRSANMIADSYPLGFKVGLHRKDLGIALDEAARHGLALAVAQLVAEQEDGLIEDGHGDEDVSALARVPR
jgi:3-hydroxyisobutyrate dehydrogenase-like beta-hydroxyacid dehydrogenase